MSLLNYFKEESLRRDPKWDGIIIRTPIIESITNKTIVPSDSEKNIYKPNRLVIVETRHDTLKGWKFLINEELHKFETDIMGFSTELVIVKSSISWNTAEDSIFMKWSVLTPRVSSLSKMELGRLNGARGTTHCYSCKAPLIPLWGMIFWCPTCEKD